MNPLKLPLTQIKGVGAERAKDLSLVGLETIEDLLFYFPYRYEDRSIRDLAEVGHDEQITIEGSIHSEPLVRFYGKKKSRLTVRVLVERYLITAIFFNRHYSKSQFSLGKRIKLTGKWNKHRMQLTVQEYKLLQEQQVEEQVDASSADIVPIYSTAGKLSIPFLKKLIAEALHKYGEEIPELIPDILKKRYKLMDRKLALRLLHLPTDLESIKWARRRMIFEELFLFQLKIHALRKIQREHHRGQQMAVDQAKIELFIAGLPFSLTTAQQKVLLEIIGDLESPYAMNRLLQGDVGSGKTIVAAIALFASITAGFQGALMVPTEILAEQHEHSLRELFKGYPLQLALLTGSTKAKDRRAILAGLQMGTIDLLIGTHALIQEEVYFKQLGLVIIDEQHRFGVEQRRRLRYKGQEPDVLMMTATPIPRTLAITAFGDMDVSTIDQLPAGRQPIETYCVKQDMVTRVLDLMHKELRKGRQAYFICPLIEESEKLDVQNALDTHALLCKHFPQYQIGLVHGRLSAPEKEEVMRLFSANEIQVLVSTTVVEVGVNVPNASLMIIQDAERFGLAQLHQLRGRVGRGEYQSYCILLADPKTELGKERMKIMQETNDGFLLAKRDLELRGPGDFFGKKQSGLPEFKLADLVHDYRALEVAREDSARLIASEVFWREASYAPLRHYLKENGLLDIGKLD